MVMWGGWKMLKSEDESRSSKIQHYWDRLDDWEESWRSTGNCAKNWKLTIRRKWYMHNPAATQTTMALWHTNESPNLGQKTRPCRSQKKKKKKGKKKRTCKIVDFAVPADHRIKLKASEKKNTCLDLSWELKKKLWKMKVTIIRIVIGAFGTVTKGLLKRLEGL